MIKNYLFLKCGFCGKIKFRKNLYKMQVYGSKSSYNDFICKDCYTAYVDGAKTKQ